MEVDKPGKEYKYSVQFRSTARKCFKKSTSYSKFMEILEKIVNKNEELIYMSKKGWFEFENTSYIMRVQLIVEEILCEMYDTTDIESINF